MSRHRETDEKGCVADWIRWEGGEMVQKGEAFTKQRRTSQEGQTKKNKPRRTKKKTPTSIEGNLILARGKILRLRSE